jgi:hypothetical protein
MGTALKTIAVLSMGLAFAFSDVCAGEAPMTESGMPMTESYSQHDLLKNWALSVCLAWITEDAKTRADANATASAYLEFGEQPIEAYDELRELARKYVNRKYSGSIASEFNTMKCIDLFHSAELDDLTTKLTK